MLTLTKSNRPDRPQRHRSSSWGVLAALALVILLIHPVHALQQTFWPNYQWPPPNWHFAYTNSAAVVYFTNGTTLISCRQFVLQPTTDTSITPPATNAFASYSNGVCVLSFQESTNGIDWVSAQATNYFNILLVNTNNPMYIQMTNTFFTGSNALGVWRIRAHTTKASTGQTQLTPTTGGYLISGFLNAQWEGFGSGPTYRAASTAAYLELSGPAGATALKLQVSQPTAGNVQVCWPSQTNYQYQVQMSPNLVGSNWSNLGSPVLGTGSSYCQSYSAIGGSNLFYRVVYTNAP